MQSHLTTWLTEVLSAPAYYQHVDEPPTEDEFVWLTRSGDEELDCLDETGEPDIVYFDLEIYAQTRSDLEDKSLLLRAKRDFRGFIQTDIFVDDLEISDQRDDYEPQCIGENLPPFLAVFQLKVSGYEDQS